MIEKARGGVLPFRLRAGSVRPLAVGFAGLVAAFSLTLAGGLTWPLKATPLGALLVPVRESRADAALAAGPAAYARAREETLAALALAPATPTAWLRLAYMDYARAGRLDGASQASLERSFDAAPTGPDVTEWRVRFIFENWEQASPALRRRALNEFVTTSRWRGARARDYAKEIRNLNGKLALTLAIAMSRSYDSAR